MRFFKYLFFILFLFPSLAFADNYMAWSGGSVENPTVSAHGSTREAACSSFGSKFGFTGLVKNGDCYDQNNNFRGSISLVEDLKECFHPDYKIVSQPITSLKKTICLPVNGAICKYTGDPTGTPVINGSITTTFSSVSKTPDPTCKEELVNPPCDPKNPYGGCFTPAADGCTRQFNGSIECPAQTSPSVEKGCNGATYCDRPPQGCGDGYVSGSFNGKSLCVKTSPSTGSGSGNEGEGDGDGDGTGATGSNTTDGTGTSTSTGTNTSTTTNTTTNNTTVNNFKIDFSPVVNAVKQVSADIKNLKNELLTSISELIKKVDTTNTKIDETNSKLDTSNTNLTSIKDSSLRQEELLKSIRDKSGSGSASGAQTDTDLSGVNSRLDGIKEGIDKKNTFDKELSDWMKEPIKESDYAQDMPTNSLEIADLNTTLYKLTGSCPAPFTFTAPVVNHTFTIDISRFCDVLAIIGILISIAACIHGIAILAENT